MNSFPKERQFLDERPLPPVPSDSDSSDESESDSLEDLDDDSASDAKEPPTNGSAFKTANSSSPNGNSKYVKQRSEFNCSNVRNCS